MTRLFGLSYSNPAIVLAAVDTALFRCLFFHGKDEVQDAVVAKDHKQVVVCVTSLGDLKKVADTGADVVLFFEDPAVVHSLPSCTPLDSEVDPVTKMYKQVNIPIDSLNKALFSEGKPLNAAEIPAGKEALASLREFISFENLIQRVLAYVPEAEHDKVRLVVCAYVAGTITRDSYLKKAIKPAQRYEESAESILELDRFIDQSKEGKELCYAFFDLAEHGMTEAETAERNPLCRLKDLRFMVSIFEPKKGMQYPKYQ